MPPASPHGEHFAEVVLVRHGETDWNVARIVQVDRFFFILCHSFLATYDRIDHLDIYSPSAICNSTCRQG
jgi:hypothetical protein